jgi:hypothetical protein
MTSARTICGSGETSILYPKKNKPNADEMAIYWRDIYAAQRIAESGYRAVIDCAKADLIVKITLDTLNDNISLLVTDADSGDSVFSETRSIQDSRSDLVHAAQHFLDHVKNARVAAQAEQARLAEEYSQQQKAEAAKREQQRCQAEFASLKQNIIAYAEVQHTLARMRPAPRAGGPRPRPNRGYGRGGRGHFPVCIYLPPKRLSPRVGVLNLGGS